uniref:Variant surface glycoprotein n=1 Tax=Trypanosoma brucei TaxID=5691 RepID=A0A1J0R9F1_9TRYP|nr:variant surface glycoprotein 1125.3137 [Trypanosoma brucei]ARB50796.1 variant surface glycoprotein [Trypanosoma brucei]
MHGETTKATLTKLWGKITAECNKTVPSGSTAQSVTALSAAAKSCFTNGSANWGSAMTTNLDSEGLPATRQNIIWRYIVKEGTAPGCTSASFNEATQQKGICIAYKDLVKDGKGITWVNEISKAAAALEKIATNTAEQIALLYKAETVESQMEALLSLRSLTQTKAPATLTQTTLTAADCNNHKTNKTCTDNNCKWEAKDGKSETDGTCKPKDGEGQTNTAGTETTEAGGPGETPKEGAVSAGCAKHGTDKAKCEVDKTGDEKDCAWRKGKDNEDDKETEKCRDSGFFVNKKFSLMTAAFMGLVIILINLMFLRIAAQSCEIMKI